MSVTDASGEAINYNDAFATFHRFRSKAECPTSLSGMRERVEALTPDGKVVPPDERAVSRALRGETDTNVEYNMRRRDTGETWIGSFSFSPIRGTDGAIVGAVVVARDVTERKQAEAALRESEEFLRESQEIAGIGSYSLDIRTDTWTGSDVMDRIFGIGKENERTVPAWADLIQAEDRAGMVAYFTHEVLGEGKPFDREYRIVRPSDGALRWVHGLGRLEFDAQGRPVKMCGTIQDITEHKQSEAALRESRNLLQLFIDQAPVSLAMFDNQMRYLAASRRWKEDNGLWRSRTHGTVALQCCSGNSRKMEGVASSGAGGRSPAR